MAKTRFASLPELRRRSASKWAGQCSDCGEWNTLVESAERGVVGYR